MEDLPYTARIVDSTLTRATQTRPILHGGRELIVYSKTIRESVDSLCRDVADLPRAPYIGKACTRLNGESLSLFRGLTMVLK